MKIRDYELAIVVEGEYNVYTSPPNLKIGQIFIWKSNIRADYWKNNHWERVYFNEGRETEEWGSMERDYFLRQAVRAIHLAHNPACLEAQVESAENSWLAVRKQITDLQNQEYDAWKKLESLGGQLKKEREK